MQNRFFHTFPALSCLKSVLFTLATLWAGTSFAQNQDTIIITGIAYPTCQCDGGIDITVTQGNQSPPGTNYAYFWSNGANTQDIFGLCPGTYCVTVVGNGTSTTPAIRCFTVPQLPYNHLNIVSSNTAPCNSDSSGIGHLCEKVCPGTTVTYSVFTQSSGGIADPIGWNVSGATTWTVNTSTSPFFSSITVTWGNPGTGSISVFSDAAQGCAGLDFLCVTIVPEPQANFQTSPTAAIAGGPLQVCLGQTVQFQNLSTGAADQFEWFFSDDFSISALENPQHTYLSPGTHSVRLIAKSDCLCSDTTYLSVEVINAVAPTLECVGTVCPGATVTYTANSACAPYSWSVDANGTILGGGTPNSDTISVQWNSGPIGTITLGAQPCSGAACPVPTVIEVPVISGNAQIRGQERVCPGARETYTIEPFGGTGFTWSLSSGGSIVSGQGTNRITVDWFTVPNPAPAAEHILSVQYDNCYLGCGGTATLPVRILPSFGLSGPVELCDGANGNFLARLTSNNNPILCNWTLIAPNGGNSWTSPAASASPNIPFLSGAGTYRLFAVPADPSASCIGQAEWTIAIRGLPTEPTGILGETTICPGGAYAYEATGLPAGANVRWTLQNGPGAPQTLNGNPLVVNWAAAGPYSLSAAQVSKDGLGCLSDTLGLVVSPIQTPGISGDVTVCANSKGVYSIPNFSGLNIVWSISPATVGAVANGQGSNNIEVFWNQPGNHSVNVSVCGQNAAFVVSVLANPVPVPQLPAGLCPGATALVQTSVPFAAYAWKNAFGAVVANTPTTLLGPGTYAVEVVDADGCTGSSPFSIEAWDQPNISLTTADPTGFCNNSSTVSLTALTNTNSNYSYQWFQNNIPIPGATGNTYFTNQYGSYTVQATNTNGCMATAGPIVLFNYCGGGGGGSGLPGSGDFCAPGTVQIMPDPTPRCDSFHLVLNDLSGMYVASSGQWVTGLSGGGVIGTATGDEASFVYGNAGKYLVLVQVTLSDGSVCVALDSVFVVAVARFEAQAGCPGADSHFENTTEILPQTGIAGYNWDFGDPASGPNNLSSIENPAHEFAVSGSYAVTMTVTTAFGCTSSATQLLPIPNAATPVFANPAASCAGNALEFEVTGNIGILNIVWDFGDPASGPANMATGNTVYHEFLPGTYDVTATATNVQGCTATFTQSVTVAPNALSGNISPNNPLPICAGTSITLDAPPGGVSYLWSDGNGTSTQSLLVEQEGSYRVTITDANGCSYAPPAVTIRVNQAPDALIKGLLFNDLGQVVGVSYPTVTVCAGEDVALQGVSNGAATYSWSVGGTDPVIFYTDDRNTLLPVGTHVYSVTVTAVGTGCTAVSDPFLVTVNPVPDNFFISSSTFCAGSPNVITYNGPTPPGWQFFWNNGVSGTTLNTEQPGTYFIRVINEFGCEARSNPHTIMPGPPVSSIPAGCHTRCRPDTICLPNIPNIVSWQWFLDGSPIPGATNANFVAQQSGTYWAQLTDIYGCSAESDPLSLNLLDGFGNIIGNVWADVNNNGVIDAGDTLLAGVTVVILQNGTLFGAASSGSNGQFALTNVLSTQYSFNVDPFSLPTNWNIVIGNDQTTLSGCNASGSVDFLLRFACQTFGTLQLGACPGGFATYNGSNIAVGNSQIFQLTSLQGCDSTLVVSVVALPTSSSTLSLSACPGGTANYNGTDIPVGSTQNFTFPNAVGCDSMVTVSVVALQTSSSMLSLSACPGNTANYNGTDIPAGSTQNFTFPNAVGCDSVVTVNVVALQTSSSTLSLSACPGGTASYNGTDIPVGSTQNFTFPNAVGCDSVVTVSVTALTTSAANLNLSTCPGGSVMYNGISIPAGTVQNFTFVNAVGCDSMVTVTVLGDLPNTAASLSVGVCPGETYVYQGMSLSAGTTQQFTLTNFAGCDSVVTLTVFQKNVSANVLDVRVCPGEVFTYAGQSIPPGESREFQFVNAEQCDSIVTVFVSAFPETIFGLNTGPSCTNSPTGTIEAIGTAGGPGPYQYSLNQVDFQASATFNNLQSGAYTIYLRDANGCVFERQTTLAAIPPLQVELADGILPCDSTGVRLEAALLGSDPSILQFEWWNGARQPSTVAVEAGQIWVEVRNQCETQRREASVYWAELGKDVDIVYVPNVFMPSASNSDNATFRPLFAAGITLLDFRFEVYDRWGNLLFESTNTADAWDGVFRSKAFNPGVLVWQLHADVGICGRVLQLKRKGDVTVVR